MLGDAKTAGRCCSQEDSLIQLRTLWNYKSQGDVLQRKEENENPVVVDYHREGEKKQLVDC